MIVQFVSEIVEKKRIVEVFSLRLQLFFQTQAGIARIPKGGRIGDRKDQKRHAADSDERHYSFECAFLHDCLRTVLAKAMASRKMRSPLPVAEYQSWLCQMSCWVPIRAWKVEPATDLAWPSANVALARPL